MKFTRRDAAKLFTLPFIFDVSSSLNRKTLALAVHLFATLLSEKLCRQR